MNKWTVTQTNNTVCSILTRQLSRLPGGVEQNEGAHRAKAGPLGPGTAASSPGDSGWREGKEKSS